MSNIYRERTWVGKLIWGHILQCRLQLSRMSKGSAKYGHDVLPQVCHADGDMIPRIRARLGVLAAQYAPKDALI
jgi:hypothetical protein